MSCIAKGGDMDQIRDLGFWRKSGEALCRLRQRRRLSLRDCAQATGLCAEDLLNVEVGNIFAFIHGGKLDADIFTAYERFLKNGVTPAESANDSTFRLIAAQDHIPVDPALPSFLRTI